MNPETLLRQKGMLPAPLTCPSGYNSGYVPVATSRRGFMGLAMAACLALIATTGLWNRDNPANRAAACQAQVNDLFSIISPSDTLPSDMTDFDGLSLLLTFESDSSTGFEL